MLTERKYTVYRHPTANMSRRTQWTKIVRMREQRLVNEIRRVKVIVQMEGAILYESIRIWNRKYMLESHFLRECFVHDLCFSWVRYAIYRQMHATYYFVQFRLQLCNRQKENPQHSQTTIDYLNCMYLMLMFFCLFFSIWYSEYTNEYMNMYTIYVNVLGICCIDLVD